MAGHSHWHNIRFKKGRQDLIKARNNRRFSQEISSAVQKGRSPKPEFNNFLRSAIQSAKSNGVAREVIEKAIDKALESKASDGKPVLYEVFCPGGVAIVVEGFSENLQNSSAKMKEITSKYGGTFAGCLHLFKHEGIAEIADCKIEDILSTCGDLIEDFFEEQKELIITFNSSTLCAVQEALQSYSVNRCENIYIAEVFIKNEDRKIRQMIDAIENLDFVQSVFSNIESQ